MYPGFLPGINAHFICSEYFHHAFSADTAVWNVPKPLRASREFKNLLCHIGVQDADRIILMESGRISAIGNHEELMKTSDVYRDIYTSQNRVGGDKDGK